MSSFKRCDRCGESNELKTYLTITRVSVETSDDFLLSKDGLAIAKDLCDSCRRSLKDFLEPLPKAKEPNAPRTS